MKKAPSRTTKPKDQRNSDRAKRQPHSVKSLLRRKDAVELRVQGLTYLEISVKLEVTKWTVIKWIQWEMARVNAELNEPVLKIRETEWATTEMLMEQWVPRALDGELDAVGVVLRLLDRRAKLKGIDAPVDNQSTINLNVSGEKFVTQDQMAIEVKKRMARIGQDLSKPATMERRDSRVIEPAEQKNGQ